jgi:hypothetical protein
MGMSADQLTLTAQDLTALNAFVTANSLSNLTFLQIMKRAGLLPDEMTPEVEIQRLTEQRAAEPQPQPIGSVAPIAAN